MSHFTNGQISCLTAEQIWEYLRLNHYTFLDGKLAEHTKQQKVNETCHWKKIGYPDFGYMSECGECIDKEQYISGAKYCFFCGKHRLLI